MREFWFASTLGANAEIMKEAAKCSTSTLYKGGRVYQHPTDKTLVWKANGQKPNWLRDLEAQGGKAVEVEAERG